MHEDESDLRRLSAQELRDLYWHADREMIGCGHAGGDPSEIERLRQTQSAIKAEIDRRLTEGDREPELMSSPVADMEREISDLPPNTQGDDARTAQRKHVGRKADPDVARRRTIVKNASNLSSEETCRQLDFEGCRPPTSWEGVDTWQAAYRVPKYRSRVHTMLNKDRDHHA
jgi:hypothetical protein